MWAAAGTRNSAAVARPVCAGTDASEPPRGSRAFGWPQPFSRLCLSLLQRKSSKAKEKKQKRLEERAAMDAVCAKVDAANRVTPSFPSPLLLEPRLGFQFDFFWRHPVAGFCYCPARVRAASLSLRKGSQGSRPQIGPGAAPLCGSPSLRTSPSVPVAEGLETFLFGFCILVRKPPW